MRCMPRDSTVSEKRTNISRELSMLAFNARVLHEASDERNALLERFRFLGIVASNLDEFFAIRVSSIREQDAAGIRTHGQDGMTPQELLREIRHATDLLATAQQATWKSLKKELADAGHHIVHWKHLDPSEEKILAERFVREVLPVLTPLAVDPTHPFPFISSLGLSLAVRLHDHESKKEHFARVKIPGILGRLFDIGGGRSILAEELIAANAAKLFVGHEILDVHAFRVTRDADIDIQEGEADDLLATMEEELKQRRFGRVVRLELEEGAPIAIREALLNGLEVADDALQEINGVLDLTVASEVARLPLAELRAPVWHGVTPAALATAERASDGESDLFGVMRSGDLLAYHPYENFESTVERLFIQAASDPDVLSIRSTLYRTGLNSTIPEHLIRAAQNGKEVLVLVELKARFDEAANIHWAKRLEDAGAHVIYGMMGLKTHCKATLIARREAGVIRRYAHLGTGNYNAATARAYTDLGLFTTDEVIVADVGNLFNYLTGLAKTPEYRALLVAPVNLRTSLDAHIAKAAEVARRGGRATIFIKVNALVDRKIIASLDEAAAAGVEIDLVVRGMCGLLPDAARHEGRLRIRSIVGEFLEHSRLFCFDIDGTEEWFAGSADLMERNLDRRVEVLFPLLAPASMARVQRIRDALLDDVRNAWQLAPDGAWSPVGTGASGESSAFATLKGEAREAS